MNCHGNCNICITKWKCGIGTEKASNNVKENIAYVIRETRYIFEKFHDPKKKDVAERKCNEAILSIIRAKVEGMKEVKSDITNCSNHIQLFKTMAKNNDIDARNAFAEELLEKLK